MAIMRATSKPTLFVIMTANPDWKEVPEKLLPGQSVNNRPDIVARVFAI